MLAAIVIIGLIRPLLWTVLIAVPLWLARRSAMTDATGQRLFGHYWRSR
ncbi:MAG: hypothetical protein NHG36_15240 [Chromatiaceae bacterium]|nr:hypothetical protein [Candidatus Thioaporhodococcus sediminis]